MSDNLHGFFTLISLGLTWPALTVCVLVLYSWHSEYIKYCKTISNVTPSLKLIAGVYIAFFGSMIDNTWWGIAWTLDYLDRPSRDFWFINGVYPNVIFRQIALIWAGVLHISAENMSRKTQIAKDMSRKNSTQIFAISGAIGLLYILTLYLVHHV